VRKPDTKRERETFTQGDSSSTLPVHTVSIMVTEPKGELV